MEIRFHYCAFDCGSNTKETHIGNERVEKLESFAHDNGALISKDALHFIADFGGAVDHVLKNVIEKAKAAYPKFDGWVVLNQEQVEELLSPDGPQHEEQVEVSSPQIWNSQSFSLRTLHQVLPLSDEK